MAISDLVLLKFIKFCVVGFSGMILDFGTTLILKEKFRMDFSSLTKMKVVGGGRAKMPVWVHLLLP